MKDEDIDSQIKLGEKETVLTWQRSACVESFGDLRSWQTKVNEIACFTLSFSAIWFTRAVTIVVVADVRERSNIG